MNGNDQINPWIVNTLEEFLFYCCPECDERNQSKDLFIEHALNFHPKAKDSFHSYEVKQEPPDENFETVNFYSNNFFLYEISYIN